MFNLPNNTPYIILIEADAGYMIMSSRWGSSEGSEMGPITTFECFNEKIEALTAVEVFMSGNPNETD